MNIRKITIATVTLSSIIGLAASPVFAQVETQRPEKIEKVQKVEKVEKVERAERAERTERTERAEKAERPSHN